MSGTAAAGPCLQRAHLGLPHRHACLVPVAGVRPAALGQVGLAVFQQGKTLGAETKEIGKSAAGIKIDFTNSLLMEERDKWIIK